MALRDWMISFNNAKTMESNGEEGIELIEEYERVLEKLGEGPFTEAEKNVREEVCRNLYELYLINDDAAKAEEYRKLSEWYGFVETRQGTSLQKMCANQRNRNFFGTFRWFTNKSSCNYQRFSILK